MSFLSTASLPQAAQTGYASRLRLDQTSLFVSTQPVLRPHKRQSAVISYAEVEEDFDDDDDDPNFGNGLRSDSQRATERRVELKRFAQPTRHPQYSERDLKEIAETEEVLVPLRLNLDYESHKITDFFMWNLRETVLTPERFAIITCQDLELPVGYTSTISNAIKAQVAEYWELAQIKLPESVGLHVIVHLSVNLDKTLFEDKFEWDLGGEATPEEFAKTVVADLGIAGEFYPAIAHALHESLLKLKREMIEGHLPSEVDNQAALGAPAGWRAESETIDEWVPSIELLTQEEIERREMERERMIRRMKRESARLGMDTDVKTSFRSKRRRNDSMVDSSW